MLFSDPLNPIDKQLVVTIPFLLSNTYLNLYKLLKSLILVFLIYKMGLLVGTYSRRL